jgi:hypothetical protein
MLIDLALPARATRTPYRFRPQEGDVTRNENRDDGRGDGPRRRIRPRTPADYDSRVDGLPDEDELEDGDNFGPEDGVPGTETTPQGKAAADAGRGEGRKAAPCRAEPSGGKLSAVGRAWAAWATDLAKWTLKWLVNRTDAWGVYRPLDQRQEGSAFTRKGTLSEAILARHYEGAQVADLVGLHTTSALNSSRWLAVDIDWHRPRDPQKQRQLCGAARALWERALALGFGRHPPGFLPRLYPRRGGRPGPLGRRPRAVAPALAAGAAAAARSGHGALATPRGLPRDVPAARPP